ncbi:uncharacterized protein LOC110022266 [Phalaenopsis equestris]|uniref:uncharacterized protein LOC110022266 n=1 Tax=Phalaenopsis equestris TaxID=78828 RepID=UPI0009E26A77|nr:uncharacterized protein LOC110022266 [Phalaenopsis equestris]
MTLSCGCRGVFYFRLVTVKALEEQEAIQEQTRRDVIKLCIGTCSDPISVPPGGSNLVLFKRMLRIDGIKCRMKAPSRHSEEGIIEFDQQLHTCWGANLLVATR